jgi:hypothetical protein
VFTLFSGKRNVRRDQACEINIRSKIFVMSKSSLFATLRLMFIALYRRLKIEKLIPIAGPQNKVVKFFSLGSVELKNKSFPDFWLQNEFQQTLFRLFEDELKYNSRTYSNGIYTVSNAVVSIPSGVVRLGRGVAIWLMGGNAWFLRNPRYAMGFLASLVSLRPMKFECGLLILLPFDNNYYHWLIETLPRLSLFEARGKFPDGCFLYMPSLKERPSFVWDSIDAVGWSHRTRNLTNGSYRVNRLMVPTLTAPRGHISNDALLWLRSKFVVQINLSKSSKEQLSERIYVSRDDALVRKVVNSKEVDALMSEFGFRKVVMSGMTVSEQAIIFSSASVIVGLHGAALANVAFCRRGATLLEIFMDGWFTKAYFNIARQLEMSYGCFLAENLGGHMRIDVADLRILLDRIVRTC